ncbi:HypA [Metarhizium brunneum]
MSPTKVETIETPFTSGAVKSGSSLDFWRSYVQARPSPTEDFFRLISQYHKTHGNGNTGLAHDVGTGPGNIAARLATYFDRVVGSDVNDKALTAAPALLPQELGDRVTFITSPAEALAEKTPVQAGGQGNTDLITVSECMPLLDAPKALESFHQLLRPGGTLGIYFYGPCLFADGDVESCNKAYDKVATRICRFNQPMKGTPGFPFHLRGAETLISYLDNIAIPQAEWESVERHKWNCDFPLIFNSKAGFDFDFNPVDRRHENEITKQTIDRNFWGADWSIEDVQAYLESVYPNYRQKAGHQYSEVEVLLEELRDAMGGESRKVTFPVVLILATKKAAPDAPTKPVGIVPTTANRVQLSVNSSILGRVNDIPADSVQKANDLLQKNHDELHIFWRDVNGHNHMAHSLLTTFAMGGDGRELQRAYDDGISVQRPAPELDNGVVNSLADDDKMLGILGQIPQYTNVLAFFEEQIDQSNWKEVLHRYCFSRTRLADTILARMYEGAYHPIIHLGLGVEFEQPSIIAEALAQAVTHPWSGIPECLLRSDELASQIGHHVPSPSLVELFEQARANDVILHGPRWEDMGLKMRDGVLGRSKDAITSLAAQLRVDPTDLERRAAESINCSAFLAGASQRSDKAPKIDFFHMHAVTSSIFVTVLLRQTWISHENKVRIVEWKGRTDLLWYAASRCAAPRVEEIVEYEAKASSSMGWSELYRAINKMHDDGHVAKFVRALKSGQDVSRPFEKQNPAMFPLQGDAWLNLARMAYDSTVGLADEAKWVWGAGFEQAWANVPARI